jgi:hypothetical protein
MMMAKKKVLVGLGAGALVASVICIRLALATGLFPGLPMLGWASYCAGTNITGTQCAATVPAGPTAFTGSEVVPTDVYGPNSTSTTGGAGLYPQTMFTSVLALGNGPVVVNVTAGAQTIPNNTGLWVENVGNTSTTITMPALPVGGQIQRVDLGTAQTTSILFAANAGQSCIPACPQTKNTVTAGTGFAWVYNAANTTWYSIQ